MTVDEFQAHLMRHADRLHKASSRDLDDPENMAAVTRLVCKLHSLIAFVPKVSHTAADTVNIGGIETDGLCIPR